MSISRLLKHWWLDTRHARRALPPDMAKRLEAHIGASELAHSGEIRIAIEASLPQPYLWMETGVRRRAESVFAQLNLWDTEHRNGVLIYLLLADHKIEIVADRGLNQKVSAAEWGAIVQSLSASLQGHNFEGGLNQALRCVSERLTQFFPIAKDAHNPNELSNLVVWL